MSAPTTQREPAREIDLGEYGSGESSPPRARRGLRRAAGHPPAVRRGRGEKVALTVLLVATAALYLWDLGASGYANSFYSAAVQAGSQSWKAMFFGSFDAGNAITVDKPPAALWVMSLSVRIFGLSSWAVLVPQALMGVGTVALVHASVRRWFTPVHALLAGAVVALTPVAVLMFRFNNPDAMLVLLLTGAAYAVTRALENASPRWLMLAGALVGFGFLAKMMQAFLVVPAFALVYLVCAPTPVRKRLLHLVGAGVAMVAASAWWIAIVELWPASSRPYIGGSQTNSIMELVLGYNGFGRLTGNETGSVGGGGGAGGGMWGETGLTRLFNSSMGGQIAWLLPAALILLVVAFVLAGRAGRTDRLRAAAILWGGWLLGTGLTFSLMAGIFHEYYNVALAPAVGAVVGIGAGELWRRRASLLARVTLATVLAVTVITAYTLLARTPDWFPWLRVVVLAGGLLAALALLVPPSLRRVSLAAASVALVLGLTGPAAYALQTVATPHSGSIVTAGPSTGGGPGGGGGMRGGGAPPAGGGQTQQPQTGGNTAGGNGFGGGTGGGAGGLLSASTPDTELTELLQQNADDYTWVAATTGSQSAAGYQLATERPVVSIGGFNGTDPAPTLAEFQQWVQDGKVHYYIEGGGMGGGRANGGSSASSEIASWVAESFTARTVGGVTVYDLTAS